MALMLGVTKRTIENRFAEFNMTNQERFSDIDDSFLDAYVERVISHFPRSGKLYTKSCGEKAPTNACRTLELCAWDMKSSRTTTRNQLSRYDW